MPNLATSGYDIPVIYHSAIADKDVMEIVVPINAIENNLPYLCDGSGIAMLADGTKCNTLEIKEYSIEEAKDIVTKLYCAMDVFLQRWQGWMYERYKTYKEIKYLVYLRLEVVE